ncbi:MAG TPA: hypothetical protein VHJ17_25035 [Thermomonospora sp.]|nr:hypothetical protein [Thermomonospora sp.]
MSFTLDAALGYYFETVHLVLLLVGLIVVVALLVVWRIAQVRRRARRGGR